MLMSRQIHRTAAIVVALASAVALTLVGSGAANAATTAQRAPWCSSSDLRVSYHATDAATSHRFGRIVLTNLSHHRCRTGGYGGLSYVGGAEGTQVGAAADRDPGRARVVVLRPGQRVRSQVSETLAAVYPPSTCKPMAVAGFRVYVPNSTKSQFVAHRTTGCLNPAVHLISHRPFHRP